METWIIVLIVIGVLALVGGGIALAIVLTRESNDTQTNQVNNQVNNQNDQGDRIYRSTTNDPDVDPVVFTVRGEYAEMKGEITSDTSQVLRRMLDENPQVRTIHMIDVPGSADDEENFRASRLINSRGIGTYLPMGSMIFSGGVDFFLAGATRRIDFPVTIGVHSWSDGERDGGDIPLTDPEHQIYFDFYQDIGISREFYIFTLQTPSEEFDIMTMEEINRFNFIT